MKSLNYKIILILYALSFYNNICFANENTAKEPMLGNNVYLFDSSSDIATVQSTINNIFEKQKYNQFGSEHYAFLFKPGVYKLDVKVGYNTQVLGLGRSPDDVTIIGAVRTQDDEKTSPIDGGPGALNNFWRSMENLSIIPTLGSVTHPDLIPKDQNIWAVSQAAPMRRIHIKSDKQYQSSGSLRLFDIGWSSGGFMANSKIDGYVISGSQQQWLSRNSEWTQWGNGNWNMIDVGSKYKFLPQYTSPAPKNSWNGYPFTSIPQTPVIAEKPSLVFVNNEYKVYVPETTTQSSGINWSDTAGVYLPISNFYVANPSDTSEKINSALASGLNILFTPGVYKLTSSINVTKANTVILGIGLPSLVVTEGSQAITIADVDGVKVAGILVDAGPKLTSESLVQVGQADSHLNHSQNPTILYDLFCRVGGLSNVSVKANTCVTINSNFVIADNLWLWRADHGTSPGSTGWNINPSDHGLIVNGNNVTIYGLAVEHFEKTQTIWNGENGKVYFYQSEIPYDIPSQDQWKSGNTDGYPAYKVSDNVKNHEAWGLGVYCFFRDAPNVYLENAIEVPNVPGISINHMVSVWLQGNLSDPAANSGIRHIINGQGDSVISNNNSGFKLTTFEKFNH